MSTRVGERFHKIELQSRTSISDGQGGYTYSGYATVRTAWAKVLKPKFWNVNQGGPATAITQGFTIRKCTDVTADWQVVYNNIHHKILHIDYSDSAEITLTCQAVLHNG